MTSNSSRHQISGQGLAIMSVLFLSFLLAAAILSADAVKAALPSSAPTRVQVEAQGAQPNAQGQVQARGSEQRQSNSSGDNVNQWGTGLGYGNAYACS